ncbi:GNAT family N-acetyltransferase [Halapricum sp. CBA1109]|uniref:GNAT family N-acetyltransferase n=1 Tax=Halapricum sp. CBA1109 TaxID=2668068 RepID=UPI0012FCD29A|nr:GNAT family N-acetyltransferase [Halapricum sp. CBA1109]MUV90967.1 GNAT family N-acetyltransferase [Halapricum sp. CBA1109]
MSDSFTVREYETTDADAVQRLHEERSWDVEHSQPEHEVYADLDDIEGTYLETGGAFLVGEHDGTVVATGGVEPVDAETVVLKRLRVDPAYQRNGYGDALLTELERRAEDGGYTEMVIDETGMNTTAQAFLEAHDFEVTETSIYLGTELLSYRKALA